MQLHGTLMQLNFLSLGDNALSGYLSPSWSAMSRLRYITFSSNFFHGSVPNSWSNWTQVKLSSAMTKLRICSALICDCDPLSGLAQIEHIRVCVSAGARNGT